VQNFEHKMASRIVTKLINKVYVNLKSRIGIKMHTQKNPSIRMSLKSLKYLEHKQYSIDKYLID
jgi:uncharacterized protein (DUF2132 family)